MLEAITIAFTTFLGVTTQRILGFGIASFLAPVALVFFDPSEAVVTTLLVGLLSCATILFDNRHHSAVLWPVAGRILLASLPGLLLGSYVVTRIDKGLLQIVFGLVVIIGILIQEYAFPKPTKPLGVSRGISLSGFSTGFLNACAGNGAPPLALWMRLQISTPDQIRQNIPATFAIMDICSLAAIHTLKPKSFTGHILLIFILLVPVIIAANIAGSRLARKINAKQYEKLVVIMLIITGLVTIALGAARHV